MTFCRSKNSDNAIQQLQKNIDALLVEERKELSHHDGNNEYCLTLGKISNKKLIIYDLLILNSFFQRTKMLLCYFVRDNMLEIINDLLI